MIDLNDENDPMLFAITVPAGRLILQFMEIIATINATAKSPAEPTNSEIVDAIRQSSRTPDVAAASTDAILVSVFYRVTTAAQKAGNV